MAIYIPTDTPTPPPCDFCGCPSLAFWLGHRRVSTCRACAIGVMPALLADAFVGPGPHQVRRAGAALSKFLAVFWRAVAHALERQKSQ